MSWGSDHSASHHNQRLLFLSPAHFCLAASRRRQAWSERLQKMGLGAPAIVAFGSPALIDLSDFKGVQINVL